MSILKDRCMSRMIARNMRDQLAQLEQLRLQDDAISRLDNLLIERRVRRIEVAFDRRKKDATPL